jgi:NCAIR mutase (PurE)-related protein
MDRKIKEIEDIAKLDIYRDKRCGIPEAILAEGKEPEWVAELLIAMAEERGMAFATRVDRRCFKEINRKLPPNLRLKHYEKARMAVVSKPGYKLILTMVLVLGVQQL